MTSNWNADRFDFRSASAVILFPVLGGYIFLYSIA